VLYTAIYTCYLRVLQCSVESFKSNKDDNHVQMCIGVECRSKRRIAAHRQGSLATVQLAPLRPTLAVVAWWGPDFVSVQFNQGFILVATFPNRTRFLPPRTLSTTKRALSFLTATSVSFGPGCDLGFSTGILSLVSNYYVLFGLRLLPNLPPLLRAPLILLVAFARFFRTLWKYCQHGVRQEE
jgi:hypothetical protein